MFFNFKSPEKREFGYKPRYYDPQRDALEQKIRNHENSKRELTEEEEAEMRKSRISTSFSSYRSTERYNRSSGWGANLRRTLTILVLFVALYWVANRYLPKFLEYLQKGSQDDTEQFDDNIEFLE
jgi:hypothetical protein